MQNATPPRKRHHVGTWIVVIVGFAEIAVLVAFVLLKDRFPSCQAEVSQSFHALFSGGATSLEGGDNTRGVPQLAPSPQAVSSAVPAAAESGSASGGVSASGDTNQVPDTKCVAQTAAGLLQSGPAPSAQPSCAPMSPPPELKKAEQQLSNGSLAGQTSAPAPSASP